VRINGPNTEFFEEDLRALAGVTVRGVMLPKAEAPLELGMPVIPLIESAAGLWNALQVARGPRVERLAFGSVDVQLDAGIQGEDEALLYARSRLVLASRIARLASPIDGVTVQIGDAARLAQDVARARDLGFGAKLCIHPNQVEIVERGFSPTAEERRWAQAVVNAFERARGSAVRLEGKLIDLPVVERARRLLA
jgi:citrate lyase subunit beta/citryl-CoA lyase